MREKVEKGERKEMDEGAGMDERGGRDERRVGGWECFVNQSTWNTRKG